jgi:hypothetical protein
MKAITLWRPWDVAIAELGKRVENRPRPPPYALLGKRIALHAGLRFDPSVRWPSIYAHIEPKLVVPTDVELSITAARAGRIFATALIAGYYDARSPKSIVRMMACSTNDLYEELLDLPSNDWWLGPVGILLRDVFMLPYPIFVRGFQGWWTIRDEVRQEIEEQERER